MRKVSVYGGEGLRTVGTAGEEEEHDGCAFGPLLSELPRYAAIDGVEECGYEAVAFWIWCACGRRSVRFAEGRRLIEEYWIEECMLCDKVRMS